MCKISETRRSKCAVWLAWELSQKEANQTCVCLKTYFRDSPTGMGIITQVVKKSNSVVAGNSVGNSLPKLFVPVDRYTNYVRAKDIDLYLLIVCDPPTCLRREAGTIRCNKLVDQHILIDLFNRAGNQPSQIKNYP